MRFLALATDYDGTLACGGVVDQQTIAALERLRNSSRRMILVTGRELDDLLSAFPRIDLFERVVAENGALLYRPETQEQKLLAHPPPQQFVEALRNRHVSPLSVGRVIVATSEPNKHTVLDAVQEQGLELQLIFNKGSLMVLPSGVNKATGLAAALDELSLTPANVIGIADAENDHAFLQLCGYAVAVENALPALKKECDFVAAKANGAGVVEVIDKFFASDLADR